MPEDFADGEDEEEEDELGESTQQTVLPDSQDLFIILAEIPSQPNKAREGTSAAANVSSLPPPSQRLSHIRWRKKCTCNEMFSELMQSSGTDRAVWRDTIAEYRTVADECEERWQQEDQRRHEAMLGLLRDQTDMLRRLVEVHEHSRITDGRCSPCLTALPPPQVPSPPHPDAQERGVGERGSGHPTTPPQWTAQTLINALRDYKEKTKEIVEKQTFFDIATTTNSENVQTIGQPLLTSKQEDGTTMMKSSEVMAKSFMISIYSAASQGGATRANNSIPW
ncbi:uncharacterized protein LOC122465980 [Chelonia mydas]|uniref:uncharacterized protein LOC122465980 n=1 Tax=Chelonia mydas TaxID=8469 RepID=UPI001CA82A87|nr:uncharacterized protein LOC122465980 [Chelonia mydas]